MNAISDVLAFAAANADYWNEFLSGADYSSILSAEEVRALEAARLHVEEGIYQIALECGRKLEAKLQGTGVIARNFQRGPTVKKRVVRIDPPQSWKDRLYGMEFEFSADEANARISLYGSLVVKKGSRDALATNIAQKMPFKVDDYYIFAPGQPLEKGIAFSSLADQVASDLADLFLAAS